MSTKYWRWSIVCAGVARLMLGHAGAAPLTIGIALPQGQPLPGAESAEPLRQSLISQLKAQSIDAVPLKAIADNLADAEAQAEHCRYVLYTHLEKRSPGALRGKLSAFTGALPFGAFTGKGAASSIAGMAMQGAANAAASSAQQQAMSQLAGASYASVKRGDSMAMAYRLVAVGSTNPTKSETFDSNKAGNDGQDIVSPLIAQVAGAVSAAVENAPSPSTQVPSAQVPSAQVPSPAAPGVSPSPAGRPSLLSGLWGHRSASSTTPAGAAPSSSMDCAKLASVPNAPMSQDACEKLQGAQQAYNQAASNPAASHAGDDQMTCTQITAEIRQQQYAAPDRTKVAQANATVNEQQSTIHREYANMVKQQAEDQAAVAAATAADTATEVATAGLVRGRALNVVEKTIDARHQANNERVIREDLPTTQKMVGQMADFGGDFGQQLQSNPRLARLMQLADTKRCKGGT